jgi:membrane fusion protein, heavy metal efflux system
MNLTGKSILVAVVLGAMGVAAILTQSVWRPLLSPTSAAPEEAHSHGDLTRVQLTAQARANLGLVVKAITIGSYQRTLEMPGQVVEPEGCTDRRITALLGGIVTHVGVFIGDSVRPGDDLFTLRLNSELVQNAQAELFKTARELQITQDQRAKIEKAGNAIPEARFWELDYQQRRLSASLLAYRFTLASRGLSSDQIQGVEEGRFVTEITIRVPTDHPTAKPGGLATSHSGDVPVYVVEELAVRRGEQVNGGQLLAVLADHHSLYIEGRAFKQELPLIERAAQERWVIAADILESGAEGWPLPDEPMTIQRLGNRVDPGSQTLSFFVNLPNTFREHTQGGRTYRTWRFQPGQRVRLRLPVEQFDNVFVLPAEAIVREGAEAYVFRANGDAFDRKPVHVLHEDRRNVVIANDGSILEGNHIAQNAAAQLNRALKSQASGDGSHGHSCCGHEH